MKKLTALLLFALILSQISCGEAAVQDESTSGESTSESLSETTADDYDYPDKKFDGHEFVFLNVEPQSWANALIAPEESTGETINDAMFERNSRISDRFDITIREERINLNDVASTIKKTVGAGDDVYDVCMLPIHQASGVIGDEYLLDLNSVGGLNLDSDWWDKSVNDSLTIAGKLYMTTSDISFFPFEATWGIFFSEKILDDLKLEYPYELVRSGKWTIDRLNEYAKAGALQGSADSFEPYNIDGDARYGFASHHDFPLALIFGAGESFIEVENGKAVFNADSERMFGIYDKIAALTAEKGAYYNWDFNLPTNAATEFIKGRFVMCSETLGYLSKLREMKESFGVLPVPKYDEAQEEYHSIIASWGTLMTTVPATASDPERTGIILDALAYDSYRNLREPYYNTYLTQKGVRNDDSAEMLEVIRKSRGFAADIAFGWSSNIANSVKAQLKVGDASVASTIESLKSAAMKLAGDSLGK